MNAKTKSVIDTFRDNAVGILLAGALSMGVWLVSSIHEQNIRLTELLLEVKSVNERLGQYATKYELHELEKRFEVYIASVRPRYLLAK